jgi:hypothetical protein
MTTFVCWKSVDDIGCETLNLCADSRFRDGTGKTWDRGRKLFFSSEHPDVFGFVGEVLPPQTVLGQLIEAIDSSSLGTRSANPFLRLTNYKSHLDATIGTYPLTKSVEVLFATRDDRSALKSLHMWSILFNPGESSGKVKLVPVGGSKSGLIMASGTGAKAFNAAYAMVRSKPQGHTSRAVYWAFMDLLSASVDPYTGGPPQLVRLGNKGSAIPVGVSYGGERFVLGFELHRKQLAETQIKDWHDELYQFIDPVTGEPRSNAQKIARP